MIPLAEWSRKRPARGYFSNGELDDFDDGAEAAAADFDVIIDKLLESSMLNVRCDEASSQQQRTSGLVAAFATRLQATSDAFTENMRAALGLSFNAVLRPWIGQQIAQSAIDDFCNSIAVALGKDVARDLAAEVPDALQNAVRQRLADLDIPISLTSSDDGELHARLGNTAIKTEMAAWQERLKGLLP